MTRVYGTKTLDRVMQKVSHDGNPRPYKKTTSGGLKRTAKKFKPSTIMGMLQIGALGGLPLLQKMLSKQKKTPKKRKKKDGVFKLPSIDSRGNIRINLGDQYAPGVDASGNIDFSSFKSPFKKKKKDPLFLNTKNENVKELKKNESITDSMGQLYTLFRKIDEKETLAEELRKSQRTEELLEEEKRHVELIQALESISPTGKPKKGKPKAKKLKEPKEPPSKAEPPAPKVRSTTTPAGRISAGRVIGGAAIGAVAATSISEAIAQGESAKGSYNAANMGTKGGKIIPAKPVNLEEMTIKEVMRRQSISWGSPNESEKLFAVGKYQMIPSTLKEGISALGISPDEKYSRAVQEKLFKEYLIGTKNPAISAYLDSPVDDPKLLHAALKRLSTEWASVADPDIPGGRTSHYGSGNKASISVDTMTNLLKSDREKTQQEKASRATQESKITPVPTSEEQSQRVSTASATNKDLKKETTNMNNVAVTQNNVKIVSGNKNYRVASAADDNPAFMTLGN